MNGDLRSAEVSYGSHGKCSGWQAVSSVRKRLHFERARTRFVRRGSKFRAKPKSPRVIYARTESGRVVFGFGSSTFAALVFCAIGESERHGRGVNLESELLNL